VKRTFSLDRAIPSSLGCSLFCFCT
jgi:hypothetical protein